MKTFSNKSIGAMSIGFALIFLGYNTAQQYITSFFSSTGSINAGFYSLILIYSFFIISGPLSAVLVSRFGAKKCMLSAAFFYALFIFSLSTQSAGFVYFAAIVLGFAASLLWTGQGSYLIRASDSGEYGKNSGEFASFLSVGSAIGVLASGLALSFIFLKPLFFVLALFPLAGILFVARIDDIRPKVQTSQLRLVKKALNSITAVRMSLIWFYFAFITGLIIAIIPLKIKNILGLPYVGFLSSLYFIIPIIFSFLFGALSDAKDRRRKMIVYAYVVCLLGLILIYFAQGSILLVIGIILLSLNFSIIRPITLALVGDVSVSGNIESLAAFFWIIQNFGTIFALFLGRFFHTEIIYLLAIAILGFSFIMIAPLLRIGFKEVKIRISRELSIE